VGIEHMHSDALRKNSVVSSTEVRITEDSRHSARWALSRVQSAQEENSLSSDIEEESKEKDLHRVVEHPEDSARGCLS
jgi:hypothetical protein